MRCLGLWVFLCWTASAQAQVAVAVTLPDNNPTHRDVAAGLVSGLKGWKMLSPQLDPVEVAVCKTEFGCLQRNALARGASHLLVIGIAGLGVRDYVVSFQLYDAHGKKLVDENTVETAGADPFADGAALGQKLWSVPGVPKPPPAIAVVEAPALPSTLALTGMALVAGGAVVGVGTAVAALGLAAEPSGVDRDGIMIGTIAATTLGALLGVAGAACVVVDAVD